MNLRGSDSETHQNSYTVLCDKQKNKEHLNNKNNANSKNYFKPSNKLNRSNKMQFYHNNTFFTLARTTIIMKSL